MTAREEAQLAAERMLPDPGVVGAEEDPPRSRGCTLVCKLGPADPCPFGGKPPYHSDGKPVCRYEVGPRAVLRRLRCQRAGVDGFIVGGRWRSADNTERREVDMGPVGDGAWWELTLPPCPDCGGQLEHAEAGWVPGARQCSGCGAMWTVDTVRGDP